MATTQQEQEAWSRLSSSLDKLTSIDPDSLVRQDLGKDLNFQAGLPVIQRTIGLYRDLAECNLQNIPFEVLNNLAQQADAVLKVMEAISGFSVAQYPQNPIQARDSLIQNLRDRWNADYSLVSPVVSFAVRKGTDFDALEREARGTLALQKQLGEEFKLEKDKILLEMQTALSRVRQAAAEAGVAQHAIHFKEEAEFHREQSKHWMYAAAAFGAIVILYSLFGLPHGTAELDGKQIFSSTLPHLVVVIILTLGLVWSIRNYGASRHNFVVNRHRQNALSSFETFVKGASDAQTKDAVLLQATQSVFAPQESGFVKGDNIPQPGSQIIEILRGIGGAGTRQ